MVVVASFTLCTFYLMAAALILVANNVRHLKDGVTSALSQILPTMIATFGAYIFSAVISGDVAHLFTSMAQLCVDTLVEMHDG
jgi:uncharacterized membrane protein